MDVIWKQPDGNGGYYAIYHETKAELVKYSDTTVANVLNNLPMSNVSEYMQGLLSTTDAATMRKVLGVNRAIVYDECPMNWLTSGRPAVSDGKITFGGSAYARRASSVTLGGSNPFTVEFSGTANIDTTSGATIFCCLYSDDNYRPRIVSYQNVGRLAWVENGTTTTIDATDNIYNEARHLAMSYDGATVRFFSDGVLAGSFDQVLAEKRYQVYLGTGYYSTGYSQGKVSLGEVRISDICRYSANFTPPARHEVDEHTLTLLHFDD